MVAGFRSTRPELECALKVVILCSLFFFFFFLSWMDGEWRGGLVWFEGHRFTTSFSLRLFHGVRTTGTSYESHNCQIPPPPFTVTTESSSWPRYFVVYSNDAVRTTAWNFHGWSRDYFTARLAFVSLSLGRLVVSCFNANVFVKWQQAAVSASFFPFFLSFFLHSATTFILLSSFYVLWLPVLSQGKRIWRCLT